MTNLSVQSWLHLFPLCKNPKHCPLLCRNKNFMSKRFLERLELGSILVLRVVSDKNYRPNSV